MDRARKPLGVTCDDYVIGDMTDAAIVRDALSGCAAVVHAAATFYGGSEVLDANVQGVHNVVGAASELGLDPVIYISTIAAMYPPPGDVITVDDPIVNLKTTYGQSKAEGERFARARQAENQPVVTIYPAGVYGPGDPGPGETMKGLRDGLRFGWPITKTGISIVDVRDLAGIVVAALEPERGPRRYMAGGHFLTWPEFADLCDGITGRRTRRLYAPPLLLRGFGHLVDMVRRVIPFDYPLTHEATLMMTRFVPCDSDSTVTDLGISFRPTLETMADSIRWLYELGEIDAKLAGRGGA